VKIFLLFFCFLFTGFASDVIPFDKTKIQGYSNSTNLDNIVAPIVNQIWIASKKLSKEELTQLVLNKYKFKIISYNKVYGLLIQIDENDKSQLQVIEDLKKEKDIDNVYYRVYEGNRGFSMMANKKD